jgi:hypothetical protein
MVEITKPMSLHERLMEHFRECFPLREIPHLRHMTDNMDKRNLYIEGHGTFEKVEDYAIVPRELVLDAPVDNLDGVHQYTPSDLMLYINRHLSE